MKKTIFFSVMFVLLTCFSFSNIFAQYTNTTLTNSTNGGFLLSRQSPISETLTNWYMSSRANNQDLWFYASYINPYHGNPITDYWYPIKLNFSTRSLELLGTYVNGNLSANTLNIPGAATFNSSVMLDAGSNQTTFVLNTTSTNGNRIIFYDGSGPTTLNVKGGSSGYLDYGGTKLFNNGSVSIGTTDVTHKLNVNGTIRAKEIIVNTGWSDFVFEKDYKLLSLPEVENFINKNKHLPDVPSEKEVMENGVSLGEMQSTLLQKIEELTLYVIKQDKEIKNLKTEISNLKK